MLEQGLPPLLQLGEYNLGKFKMKRILVLTGGAFRGSIQLPIIRYLINKYQYHMIYGTSVGSINGIMTAQGEFELLEEIWDNVTKRGDLLKLKWYWPFQGLYSLSPMRSLLEEHVSLDKIQIPYGAGVVSFTDGEYYNLLSDELETDKDLWDAIQASCCMAGIMVPEYMNINGSVHLGADGGFRNIFPIPEEGGEEYYYDVIACTPLDRMKMKERKVSRNILDVAVKAIDIFQDEIFDKDILELIEKVGPGRMTLYAPQKYPGSSLDASPETRKFRKELGLEAILNPVHF